MTNKNNVAPSPRGYAKDMGTVAFFKLRAGADVPASQRTSESARSSIP